MQYPIIITSNINQSFFFILILVVGSKGAIEGTNETFQASKVIQKIRLGWVEVCRVNVCSVAYATK
jgi:hypothetical protein